MPAISYTRESAFEISYSASSLVVGHTYIVQAQGGSTWYDKDSWYATATTRRGSITVDNNTSYSVRLYDSSLPGVVVAAKTVPAYSQPSVKYYYAFRYHDSSGTWLKTTTVYNKSSTTGSVYVDTSDADSYLPSGYAASSYGIYSTSYNATYSSGYWNVKSTDYSDSDILLVRCKSTTATIRYNANGGTGGTVDRTFSNSTGTNISCTISSAASLGFSRSGYTFQGWATTKLGSVSYEANDSVYLDGDEMLVLYAVWKEDVTYNYTITYYKNDGSSTSRSYYTTTGTSTSQSFEVIECPWTLTGYTFSLWSGSATLTSPKYTVGNTYSTSSDKDIYAHWDPNSYTIYFNGNGSTSGSMSSMSCYYGSSYTLRSNTYQRAYSLTYNQNYTGGTTSSTTVYCDFLYWSCNGSTYRDGATVSNLTSTDGGSVTMYAQWEYGSVSLPTPTRSGYTFDGWYTSGGTFIGAGGSAYTVKSDQTLYAHWTASVIKPALTYVSHTDTTITVTLDRNGGTSGTWTIQASTSSSFGSIAATATITNTTTTSVTLSGLSPNTTYYIRAINTAGTATATSDTLTASTRISQFQWTSDDASNVVAGKEFADAITASKWNDLIDRVDWCRTKSGLSASGQSDVSAGTEMTAAIFNAMRNAIATMESGVTGTKTKGEEIKASYFANVSSSLKTAINAVITRL